MQSDEEHDKMATQATLMYYADHLPDAVWVLPSFGNRRPDNDDIALALHHLYDIGIFSCEPIKTPTVTYLLNKPRIGPSERESRQKEFSLQVNLAVQRVFDLDINDLRDLEQELGDSLEKTLDNDPIIQTIRTQTTGNLNGFYHYHRLDCKWFVK